MSTFKTLKAATDVKYSRSTLNQLVDILECDISGSSKRKRYKVFVTGGVGPGVTSSLFQTCYDQDYTLQTANPFLDITVGLFSGSAVVTGSSTGVDTSGKVLFPSQSVMMREKVSNYRQFAQLLLGNADSRFTAPFTNSTTADNIDEAMFISFKRLFSRDQIKRESFAMRFYQSASHYENTAAPNLNQTSESGSAVYTDVGSSTNVLQSFGGTVGNIVDSSNTSRNVGLIFYQQGVCVFDLKKILSASEHVSGSISGVTDAVVDGAAGRVNIGRGYFPNPDGSTTIIKGINKQAKFIPDLMVSASIDDIVDHLASCRFSSGTLTAQTFQNNTNINSTLIFCRATADEFNYSSNPTYVNPSTNRIRCIEAGQESYQKAFSYITTVGLYDDNDNLVAVAKMSRPIEKNDERDLTIRVRLDF